MYISDLKSLRSVPRRSEGKIITSAHKLKLISKGLKPAKNCNKAEVGN